MRTARSHHRLLTGAIGFALLLTACGTSTPAASRTLVVDKSFDMKTADPGREFEISGSIVVKAMYDTLLTFKGSDVTKALPWIASSYDGSSDAKTFTFHLRHDVKFSDGTPLTSADVVFSFNRMKNIKGNPSFLLSGITTSATDSYTVVLTSDAPNTAIPFIVPNPALGIVNSKVVMAHGGTDAANADKADTAESFLNQNSQGSGPYILQSFSTTSQVVMTANPKFWGTAPAYSKVVVRNIVAATQSLDVQKGVAQVALDLSPDQASSLGSGLQVQQTASPNVFFLFANANPSVSRVTSNKNFWDAVRYGIDYPGLVSLAGKGAIQAAGIIPSLFLGALPQSSGLKRDLTKAKAALAASGLSNPTVTLEYPSDITVNGLQFQPGAERLQANLKEVGITVNLSPAPVASSLANYRAGKEQVGYWLWGPDFPDPSDYLVFLPGRLVGLRAGWAAGADPAVEALGKQAETTVNDSTRATLYQQIQTELDQSGPIIPLFQPGQVIAASSSVHNLTSNPTWTIDVASFN
ncbi:MAG TPA: ABC transporter substrate-binding protein [Candidatus Dormibacteraeota bacterium]|jgi:peptide/nickel transport system substrate-binding protein|nr:ABC transporter substrate-binding protein [Candidatus Dormibacteraeota bacterium]